MREGTIVGGRYVLGGLLGSGGMGRVHRAWDERLRRDVALKVMEERFAGTPEFVERFEREAANAASLNHPNIVRVFDSGKDASGPPYIAMELVGGGTLKDRIRAKGALPPREAAGVSLQVAGALEAAHAAGIVHRDIKPENVLLAEGGRAKVADFGIAKATEATAVTHTSMILGTAPYLSPEQAQGQPVGPASDLYSLGVVMFEALTGRPPFGTGADVNPLAIAMKHLNEPAPAARTKNPRVPEPLERIVLALMRKDPAERHAGAAVLAEDLEAFLAGRPLRSGAAALADKSPPLAATVALSRPGAQDRPTRRRRRLVPILAVALAALLGLLATPLIPGDPVGLGTRLVSTEPASVGGSVFPEVRPAPRPPEPPEESVNAPAPGLTPEPPPETTPDGIAPPETAPPETAPSGAASTAPASASASAGASTEPEAATASASPTASGAAAEEQGATEPAPSSPPPSSPPPTSSVPPEDPGPAEPVAPEPPDVVPPDVPPPGS